MLETQNDGRDLGFQFSLQLYRVRNCSGKSLKLFFKTHSDITQTVILIDIWTMYHDVITSYYNMTRHDMTRHDMTRHDPFCQADNRHAC